MFGERHFGLEIGSIGWSVAIFSILRNFWKKIKCSIFIDRTYYVLSCA